MFNVQPLWPTSRPPSAASADALLSCKITRQQVKWLIRLGLTAGIVLLFALYAPPAVVMAEGGTQIFVPLVSNGLREVTGSGEDTPVDEPVVEEPVVEEPVVEEPVVVVPEEPESCVLNSAEAAIASAMIGHELQGRSTLDCDPTLARVARAKAADMAQRSFFSHTDPDGHGPNYLVRQAGFQLPSWYDTRDSGNNIESLAGGFANPDEAWAGWLDSLSHRTHVLGLNSFYADQVLYGVGYFYSEDSPYGHYWVVLTAPKPE